MTNRLAMIGLDNATWSLIEPYLADGSMPNLSSLLAGGYRAELRSTGSFVAESCWPEFATGRSCPEMSYWSMMEFDPETYISWYGRTPQVPYFWARPDLTSIIFDVPETGVSQDIDGLHVVGWGSHAQGHPISSLPHDLLPRIDRRFGVHPMVLFDGHDALHSPRYLANLADAMIEGIALRPGVSRWLMEQRPDWDLFVTVFGETHVLGHQFLQALTPDHPVNAVVDRAETRGHVRRVLVALDAAFGDLVASFDDDVRMLVFVTHGIRPNAIDTVGGALIPEMLLRAQCDETMLEFPAWSPGDPPVLPSARALPRHWLESRLRQPSPSTAHGFAQLRKRAVHRIRHHLPPWGIAELEKWLWRRPDWWEIRRRKPASFETTDVLVDGARRESEQMVAATWYRRHWPSMRYFVVPSFSDCHIRVNLRGRERDGVVDRSEYDAVLREIEAELRSLTDARTGRPVVAEVRRVRDDPMQVPGPPCDVVVTMTDVITDVVDHPTLGRLGPVPFRRSGEHIGEGWFVVVDGEHRGVAGGELRPRDLAATAIDLLGVPADPRITGCSAFSDSSVLAPIAE